jgi:hypothetical protein
MEIADTDLSAMEIEESSLVEEMRREIDQLFDPSFSNLTKDRNSSYAAADGVIMARCRAYT